MDEETLAVIRRVHELFRERGLTLSVAESCTGGLISHYLTNLPGASNFFEAAIISYSARSKKDIIGVSIETISQSGLISEETAREMAEKVRALTMSDYCLSTTGNLGPDTLEGKDKGLIYMAISAEGQTFSRKLRLTGNRWENKKEASLLALRFIIEVIEKKEESKQV